MRDAALQDEMTLSKKLLHEYASKADRSEQDWEPILAAYRQSTHPFVWELDFAIDPPLYRALENERTKKDARHSLELWSNAPATERVPVLMDMTATLCLTQVRANEESLRGQPGFSQRVHDRLDIWKDVFAGEPSFVPALEREIVKMRALHARIKAQMHAAQAPTATPPAPAVLRTFAVQGACRARVVGEEEGEWTPYATLPAQALERMNAFAEEYMGSTRFSIHDDGQRWLVHEVSSLPADQQQAQLRSDLDKTCGEYLQGLGVLVGNLEVCPGWDIQTLVLECEQAPCHTRTPRP